MDRLRVRIVEIALVIVLASSSFAQQRNTVYQSLATNLSAAPASLLFPISNNIGQSYHSFIVSLVGGTSCWNQNFQYKISGQVESSYDGATFSMVPQSKVTYTVDATNNSTVKYYRAAGAFPYIRLRLTHFPTTLSGGCKVNINYSGSLSSTPLTDVSQPNIFSLLYTNSQQNVCQPMINLTSESGSGVQLSIVSYSILPTTTGGAGTNFYTDSTCTTGAAALFAPSGPLVVPSDNLNSPIFIINVDAANKLAFSIMQFTAPTANAYVQVSYTILN